MKEIMLLVFETKILVHFFCQEFLNFIKFYLIFVFHPAHRVLLVA